MLPIGRDGRPMHCVPMPLPPVSDLVVCVVNCTGGSENLTGLSGLQCGGTGSPGALEDAGNITKLNCCGTCSGTAVLSAFSHCCRSV